MRIWHEAELIELENIAERAARKTWANPDFVHKVRELVASVRAAGMVEPIPPTPPGPIGPWRREREEQEAELRRERQKQEAEQRRARNARLATSARRWMAYMAAQSNGGAA